jgi:hypothetical protein
LLNANIGTNYSYIWKRGATIVQMGGTSYTPSISGNHNIIVTDGNTGCSKQSANVNITLNSLPSANAGIDRSICAGASVQIGASNVSSNTYTWSPSAGLSNAYIANPIATPTISTTYTVTVKNLTTGCTKTDAMVFTKKTLPVTPSIMATSSPVCQGSTISVTPNAAGASTINWYKNGVLLFNKPTTFVLNVTAPSASVENYTIKSLGANGCLSSFSNNKPVWVKEAAIPTISSTPAAVGSIISLCVPNGTSGSVLLTANSTTASSTYSWKLAGAYISGANSNTYTETVTTANNNKVLSVEATYANGCVRTSANRTVRLVTTGCTAKDGNTKGNASDLTEIVWENELLSAYPNPTDGLLNVNIENCQATEGKLLLYNALGQIISENVLFIENGKATQVLDLRELAKGVYTLSFQTNEGQKVQKVIRE